MTSTPTNAWDRQLQEYRYRCHDGDPRTALEMVEHVTSLLPERAWSRPEVLTTKRRWTAQEVVELVVELFDGDDLRNKALKGED